MKETTYYIIDREGALKTLTELSNKSFKEMKAKLEIEHPNMEYFQCSECQFPCLASNGFQEEFGNKCGGSKCLRT